MKRASIARFKEILKWRATLGKNQQNFLDARWIETFLNVVPRASKRKYALRILSLSPHYFIFPDAPEYRGLSTSEYLEAVYKDVLRSRENIYQLAIKPYLDEASTVFDYGCGPGFLTLMAAPDVNKIYSADISRGAIACAKILHSAENTEYLVAGDGLTGISDGSIDAVISYAVVQHLSNEIFDHYLEVCHRKLRVDGKLVMHIQLESDIWRTEQDWKNDDTLSGRLKLNYGLHCFGRSEQEYREMVSNHGFCGIEIHEMNGFDPQYDEELRSQRILTAFNRISS